MTTIEFPFSQMNGESPHQKIGAPRIRKITNGHLEQIGNVVREPGWLEITNAYGANFLWGAPRSWLSIDEGTGVVDVYPLDETGADTSKTSFACAGFTRRIPALTVGDAAFSCSAITTGGVFVAVDSVSGELISVQLFSPTTRYGEITLSSPTHQSPPSGDYDWCGAIGTRIVATIGSTLYLMEWNDDTKVWTTVWTDSGEGPCGLAETASEIFILEGGGDYYRITKSTMVTAASGTIPVGAYTPVAGSFRCSLDETEAYLWMSFCSTTKQYWRQFPYPGFSGGLWTELSVSGFVDEDVSVMQVCCSSDYDLCLSASTIYQSAVAEEDGPWLTELRALGTIKQSMIRGQAIIAQPVRVATSSGTDVFLIAGAYQVVGGAYHQVILNVVYMDTSDGTMTVAPVAIIGRGSRLGTQETAALGRGNLVSSFLVRSNEYGKTYGTLMPVRFARTAGVTDDVQVGVDLGVVECCPHNWYFNDLYNSRAPIDFGCSVDVGNIRLFSGAIPQRVGSTREYSCDHFEPPAPQLTQSVGHAGPVAGTYHYRVTWHTEDSAGNVSQSPPSGDVAIITTEDEAIDVLNFMPQATGVGNDIARSWIHIWRDNGLGGKVYRRISSPTGVPLSSLESSYRDAVSREDWETAPILYTQGARGALSGRLPTWGPPSHTCSAKGLDRVILGGLETPNRVILSDIFWASEAVQWLDSTGLEVDFPEAVTAVAAIGDAYLAASRDHWWVFYGPGPDSQGNGVFQPPRLLQSPCGVISWRQVCRVPEGIAFQGTDGHLYLISADCSQVSKLSEGASSWIDRDPDYDKPTVTPKRVVAAAAFDPRDGLLRMAQRPTIDAGTATTPILIVNTATKEISVDTSCPKASVGGDLPISVYEYDGSLRWGRTGTAAFVVGRREYSASTVGRDRNGTVLSLAIELSAIAPGGLGQWCRVRRILVHSSVDGFPATRAGGGMSLQVSFDGYETTEETLTVAEPTSTAGITSFEFCPARQKCQAIRLVLLDSTDGKMKAFHGISLDGQQFERETVRNRSGSTRA